MSRKATKPLSPVVIPPERQGIPGPLLDLLRWKWELPQPGYSAFESVFDRHDGERDVYPSYYMFRDDSPDQNIAGLTWRDIHAMFEAGLFEGMIRRGNDGYAVNEHLQHAIADFCEEVSAAYKQFEERVGRIPPARDW